MRASVLTVAVLVACSGGSRLTIEGSGVSGSDSTLPTGGVDGATEPSAGERSTGGEATGGTSTGGAQEASAAGSDADQTGGSSTGGTVSTGSDQTGGIQSTGGAHLTGCGSQDVDLNIDPAHCGECNRACLVCERRCPTCPWACSKGTCDAGQCRCPEGIDLTIASLDPMVFACSSDGYSAAACVEAGFGFCGGYCLQPGELSASDCECPAGYHQELVYKGGSNPAGATCAGNGLVTQER